MGAGAEPAAGGTTHLDQSLTPLRQAPAPAPNHTAGRPGVAPPSSAHAPAHVLALLGSPRFLVARGDHCKLRPCLPFPPPRPAASQGGPGPQANTSMLRCDITGTLMGPGTLPDRKGRG